jgi:hypothetical protein
MGIVGYVVELALKANGLLAILSNLCTSLHAGKSPFDPLSEVIPVSRLPEKADRGEFVPLSEALREVSGRTIGELISSSSELVEAKLSVVSWRSRGLLLLELSPLSPS